MGLKKHVPNLITSLNLLSGSIAVIFAVQGNLVLAAIFVAAGIFFDFFDGLAARALDVKSEVGLQMDSLADVVTSGVVPGIVMYQLIIKALPSSGIILAISWPTYGFPIFIFLGFVPLLYAEFKIRNFSESKVKLKVFALSYLTFFVWNVITTWWIYNSTPFGGVFAILADSI